MLSSSFLLFPPSVSRFVLEKLQSFKYCISKFFFSFFYYLRFLLLLGIATAPLTFSLLALIEKQFHITFSGAT